MTTAANGAAPAGQAPAADATQQTSTQQTAAPVADLAALQKQLADQAKELAEVRKEAAERRVKAKEAEERATKEAEAKAAAEKQAAADKGEWSKVIEFERAERQKALDALKALEPTTTRAERLAKVVRAEVEALEAQVGAERAASVAHLSDEDRLPILKQYAALAAGAPAAPKSTSAAPAGHNATETDPRKMNEAQRLKWAQGKSPDEVLAAFGLSRPPGVFG